jgi:hypothetical protein
MAEQMQKNRQTSNKKEGRFYFLWHTGKNHQATVLLLKLMAMATGMLSNANDRAIKNGAGGF